MARSCVFACAIVMLCLSHFLLIEAAAAGPTAANVRLQNPSSASGRLPYPKSVQQFSAKGPNLLSHSTSQQDGQLHLTDAFATTADAAQQAQEPPARKQEAKQQSASSREQALQEEQLALQKDQAQLLEKEAALEQEQADLIQAQQDLVAHAAELEGEEQFYLDAVAQLQAEQQAEHNREKAEDARELEEDQREAAFTMEYAQFQQEQQQVQATLQQLSAPTDLRLRDTLIYLCVGVVSMVLTAIGGWYTCLQRKQVVIPADCQRIVWTTVV